MIHTTNCINVRLTLLILPLPVPGLLIQEDYRRRMGCKKNDERGEEEITRRNEINERRRDDNDHGNNKKNDDEKDSAQSERLSALRLISFFTA